MRTVPSSEPEATAARGEAFDAAAAADDGGTPLPPPPPPPERESEQQQVSGAVCPLVFFGSAR